MSTTTVRFHLPTFAKSCCTGLFLLLCAAPIHAQCGEERWEVKTLQDAEIGQIHWKAKPSTVHEQLLFHKPPYHDGNPRDSTEKQVYRIDCILISYVQEDDRDWHLVVKDLVTDEKMTMEIPDPTCPEVTNKKLKKLKTIRKRMVMKVGPVKTTMWAAPANTRMRVTGVGFFDKKNHPPGFSGRELHPVTDLKFL